MLNKDITLVGRSYYSENALNMNFSGSGFYLKTKSNKLTLSFYTDSQNLLNKPPYISVFIDDERKDYCIDKEYYDLVLDNLSIDSIIKVFKRTEPSQSYLSLINICGDVTFVDTSKQLKLEFYGDSITNGFGVLSNYSTDPFETRTESFCDSFAFVAAKKLNAIVSNVSVSGFPIYRGAWNEGFMIDSVCDMISISDYNEQMTRLDVIPWDNKKYIPDIVVINLGTNDDSYYCDQSSLIMKYKDKYSLDNLSESLVYQTHLNNLTIKLISFLLSIYKLYPNTRIVFVIGLLDIRSIIIEKIKEAIDFVNNNYTSANDIIFYQFKDACMVNSFGACNHPGKERQLAAGIELANLLNKIIKGKENE